jgi:hypothetical protein
MGSRGIVSARQISEITGKSVHLEASTRTAEAKGYLGYFDEVRAMDRTRL